MFWHTMTPRRLHVLYRRHFERRYPRAEEPVEQEETAAKTSSLFEYMTGRA